MKKSVLIGLIITGTVVFVAGGVLLVSVLHKGNEPAVPTMEITTAATEVYTTEAATVPTPEETVVESIQVETSTEESVEGEYITYGDSESQLFIPKSALESYDDFMQTDGVLMMLGDLLFDTEVEWDDSSFAHTSTGMTMRGDCVNADGYVEFELDFNVGSANLVRHIKTVAVQTRDDFTALSNSYAHTYASGSKLSDVSFDTVTTQEVRLREFVDFDESDAIDLDEVSQTIDVVLRDYNAASDMKYAIVYYLRRFFGSGTIEVWDYERHENSTVTFYVSINGWNVTIRTRGGDPYVIYAAANPSNSGPLFDR